MLAAVFPPCGKAYSVINELKHKAIVYIQSRSPGDFHKIEIVL